jgi:spore germination protein YaaH
VLAWLIGGATALRSLRENALHIDIVSPAYWRVSTDSGGAAKLAEWDPANPVDRREVASIAREKGLSLLPLVGCAGACAREVSAVLADPIRRAVHVRALVEGTRAHAPEGIFLDYQEIGTPPEVLGTFLEEMADALHKQGRKLGVAVPEPCGASKRCGRPRYAYNLGHVARAADLVAVLWYDHTVDGSGPVAPRAWLERGLRRVRTEVGARSDRVLAGVPFYGRISKGLARDTAVLWSDIQSGRIDDRPFQVVARRFDKGNLSQVAKIAYGPRRRPGRLHFEDHETLAARLRVLDAHGFRSVAVWRLGGEDPCNWEVLAAWKKGERASPCRGATPVPAPAQRRVLAWVIGGRAGLESLRLNLDAIDVVSPAYWRVSADGARLEDWDSGNAVDRAGLRALAQTRGVPVVPLVACGGPCSAAISALLRDPARHGAHVAALVAAATTERVHGVLIDYQDLTVSREELTLFVETLAGALRTKGLGLGLAVPEPCGISPKCHRDRYPYDLRRLAAAVEYLAVLQYDYAVDGSHAVAPRAWVTRSLARLRLESAAHRARVFVGVPFYGRVTRGLAPDTAVLWTDVAAKTVAGRPLEIVRRAFDPEKLAQVTEVRLGGRAGTLHYEDHETVAHRLALFEAEGFWNAAVWRLGGEDPCSWDAIRLWKKRGDLPRGLRCGKR